MEQKGLDTKEPGAPGSKFRPVRCRQTPLFSALTLMGVEGTGPGCQPQRCLNQHVALPTTLPSLASVPHLYDGTIGLDIL